MATAMILVSIALAVWAARAWTRRCVHAWRPWRADYYDDPITRTRRPFEWRSCEHCPHVQTRVGVQ